MRILLPLDKAGHSDVGKLSASASERQLVIFDEDLRIFLHGKQNETTDRITIYINDATVFQCRNCDNALKLVGTGLWELHKALIKDKVFSSNLVMNNGHKNVIKIVVQWHSSSLSVNSSTFSQDDDYLPSFVALTNASPVRALPKDEFIKESLTTELSYPIYALLNVRLKNAAISSKQQLFSSLDFQGSKSCETVAQKHALSEVKLSIDFIKYELVDNFFTKELPPLCPVAFPLEIRRWDGFSINYCLPQTKSFDTHRVKIQLGYRVSVEPHVFSIHTCWETEVAPKKNAAPAVFPSQPPSVACTPVFSSIPKFTGSSSTLVPSRLASVKFKFLCTTVVSVRNSNFTLSLQIMNSSNFPLDMVVYQTNVSARPQGQLTLEKEYRLYKKWTKVGESLILISNDYKVPVIQPSETFCLDLNFLSLASGFFQTIPGLKILDLNSQEIVNIGGALSILIK
ncbi:LAMI_0F09098g1_1 [Lachancea mirantina]|uniref:LAMI_0F09098g1_1 n=1 Tax=Lachancea mirantina TaxID=1230905 RepID=A0A1G4K133_9SACH|nr:LAMI_0F09098g1_1 [Lachancea mirantina]